MAATARGAVAAIAVAVQLHCKESLATLVTAAQLVLDIALLLSCQRLTQQSLLGKEQRELTFKVE